MRWRVDRATQICLYTCAVLLGVAMVRLAPAYVNASMAVVGVASFGLLRCRTAMVVVVALVFGIWRGAVTGPQASALGASFGQTVTLAGTVRDDPGRNPKNMTVCTLAAQSLNGLPIDGKVYLSVIGSQTLQRGYRVVATGKLRSGIGNLDAEITYAKVEIVSSKQSLLEQLRQRFFTGMRAMLPDPLSGFGLGLLIGVRALIDKSLQATLNAAGLSHLIAVSGYNLTIIVMAVRRLPLRLSAFTQTAVSLWLIGGFLVVAGFSASIVRAAMVSGLGMLTGYYGYEAKPMTLVALPALITVAWNPDYLLRDAGWQLSFLAFFGIVVLAPLMTQRLIRRPTTLKLLVIESLAAQITTAPLIMGAFGNLSLVSPLSNAVILPLVPLAMLLSFGAGALAIVAPTLAAWVSLPAAGLLGLMIGMIQWMASWPHANLRVALTPVTMAGLYALIIAGTLGLWRSARQRGTSFDLEQPKLYN